MYGQNEQLGKGLFCPQREGKVACRQDARSLSDKEQAIGDTLTICPKPCEGEKARTAYPQRLGLIGQSLELQDSLALWYL